MGLKHFSVTIHIQMNCVLFDLPIMLLFSFLLHLVKLLAKLKTLGFSKRPNYDLEHIWDFAQEASFYHYIDNQYELLCQN